MKESSADNLKSLLEAIKSADVVESRIQLLSDIGELDITDKSDVASLVGALTCMLNEAILHVAAKYLDSDIQGCIGGFLGLGIKASAWSRKHLKMTVMSNDDSPEEEHSGFFYQLLVDVLRYSVASFSALARNSISSCKELMLTTENFILEQLNLTKESLLEIKRINAFGSEVQKVAQSVLDAVIRLCKVYANGINWDIYSVRYEEIKKAIGNELPGHVDHVINIAKHTIDKLCEMGIIAANDGGSLVSVLNLSWKGVVTVLQLGSGIFAIKVNVANVILNLVTLANQSLKRAAQTWSLPLKEAVSAAEAKRIFLPIKFFLINAVRIVSQYPTEAISIGKETALCVVVISSLKIYFSMGELLKAACESLVDILEPTSFHLLYSMIKSTQVNQEQKFQFLNWLFAHEDNFSSICQASSSNHDSGSVVTIFFTSAEGITGSKILLVGQVSLFLNLLKSSSDLEDDIRLWMARRLPWLLDFLADEDVYSASLSLKVPVAHASNQHQEFANQPFFRYILNSLKTFMIVMSSSPAWNEIENFLLENLFHPHILCSEIITELLSFMLNHAKADAVNDIVEKLCLLLKFTAAPESLVNPGSALRRLARVIYTVVSNGSALADCAYSYFTGVDKSHNSAIIYTALLMEGFLLNSLPERIQSIAKERLMTEYFAFLESFGSEIPTIGGIGIYGAPVFALCAALHSQQMSISDVEMKTLKFLLAIIYKDRESADQEVKNIYCRLLDEVLGIISNMKHLYLSDEMEGVILELRDLFISKPSPSAISDSPLFACKPNLAYFMAGLGHIELADSEDNPKSLAVWELYHMLLREQHWAFAHLATAAFGYFAARTSCNELWRFVPHDAALSFDLETGTKADEDLFMSELKAFLEKESAFLVLRPTSDHLRMLVKEGKMLREILQWKMKSKLTEVICDLMEIDEAIPGNKKRKLPDGISKGVKLLQSGIKVMGDGLSQWQHNSFGFAEMHDKFLTHFSRLEDVVAHLVNLANSS